MVEHGGEANIKQARPHELPKFSVIDAGTSRSMVASVQIGRVCRAR